MLGWKLQIEDIIEIKQDLTKVGNHSKMIFKFQV